MHCKLSDPVVRKETLVPMEEIAISADVVTDVVTGDVVTGDRDLGILAELTACAAGYR